MRHHITAGILLALATALLVGCGGGAAPVIPTVAQLPTVTPTEEVFFTPTPADEVPPSEAPPATGPALGATSTGENGSPALPTPTPISAGNGEIVEGPCGPAEQDAALAGAGLDLAALRTDLDAFAAALGTAAATVGEWTLSDAPDPFAGSMGGDLPLARLSYQRGGIQQAAILVMPAPEALQALYNECLNEETFFREGDLSAEATITIEPLGIGDVGAVATIVEPLDPEASDTGSADFTTEMFIVLSGDKLFRFINIPAFDEAMGLDPISRGDVLVLLSAVVNAARGL